MRIQPTLCVSIFFRFLWVLTAFFYAECPHLCSSTMPPPALPFRDMLPRSQRRALAQLEVAAAVPLRARYRAHVQPNGHILLVLVEQPMTADVVGGADRWQRTVRAIWRTRSMGLSRTEARYLVPDLAESITVAQYNAGINDLA